VARILHLGPRRSRGRTVPARSTRREGRAGKDARTRNGARRQTAPTRLDEQRSISRRKRESLRRSELKLESADRADACLPTALGGARARLASNPAAPASDLPRRRACQLPKPARGASGGKNGAASFGMRAESSPKYLTLAFRLLGFRLRCAKSSCGHAVSTQVIVKRWLRDTVYAAFYATQLICRRYIVMQDVSWLFIRVAAVTSAITSRISFLVYMDSWGIWGVRHLAGVAAS